MHRTNPATWQYNTAGATQLELSHAEAVAGGTPYDLSHILHATLVHTHICTYTYALIHTHTHTHTHTYTQALKPGCATQLDTLNTHIHTYAHAHTYTCTYTHRH